MIDHGPEGYHRMWNGLRKPASAGFLLPGIWGLAGNGNGKRLLAVGLRYVCWPCLVRGRAARPAHWPFA
jgi:hypothetical protein